MGFDPYARQNPLLVFSSFRFRWSAAWPKIASPYIEQNFWTPEGRRINAECFDRLNLVILALHPALRAYWLPEPGLTSTFDIFWNVGIEYKKLIINMLRRKNSLVKVVRLCRKAQKLNAVSDSGAGK